MDGNKKLKGYHTPRWQGLFEKCHQGLYEALGELLTTPEAARPFVVVEGPRDTFVQFAGSRERGILFDVPALQIVAEPCTRPAAIIQAISAMSRLGVSAYENVNIYFELTMSEAAQQPS